MWQLEETKGEVDPSIFVAEIENNVADDSVALRPHGFASRGVNPTSLDFVYSDVSCLWPARPPPHVILLIITFPLQTFQHCFTELGVFYVACRRDLHHRTIMTIAVKHVPAEHIVEISGGGIKPPCTLVQRGDICGWEFTPYDLPRGIGGWLCVCGFPLVVILIVFHVRCIHQSTSRPQTLRPSRVWSSPTSQASSLPSMACPTSTSACPSQDNWLVFAKSSSFLVHPLLPP